MKTTSIILLSILTFLIGCTANKTYENEVFPEGNWIPINPEYFGIEEVKRIREN